MRLTFPRKRLALFLFFLAVFAAAPSHGMGRPETPAASGVRSVLRVTDGDTLVLDGGEKVRLIGVDTPEMHDEGRNARAARRAGLSAHVVGDYARRARDFLEETLRGRFVRLEYDWERKDTYGRTLAYVYREPDGLLVNAEMIRQGYAPAFTRFPFERQEEFRRLERESRTARRGLWGER